MVTYVVTYVVTSVVTYVDTEMAANTDVSTGGAILAGVSGTVN